MEKSDRKTVLLRLRLSLLCGLAAIIGYYLAAKADFDLNESFWGAISDGGIKAFLIYAFERSRFELLVVFAIGIGALTFFCDLVAYLSVAFYGFVCGAYLSALLCGKEYALLAVYFISSLITAFLTANWSAEAIVINRRFISSKKGKSKGLYFSPLLIKYVFLFAKALFFVFAIRLAYGYLTLLII